jgi:hypothetical protein
MVVGLANCLGDLSELAAVCVCIWESNIWMIEEVEEPCAYRELGLLPLRHREGLLHIEVRVEVSRATKLISALSAEIVCRIHEIGRVIAGIWLPVHEQRRRCTAVDVWRIHDVGEDRGRGGRSCTFEQATLQHGCCVTALVCVDSFISDNCVCDDFIPYLSPRTRRLSTYM